MPVTSAHRIAYRVMRGIGPEGHDLVCWTTTAESGGSFSALDLTTGQVVTHLLHSLEAYPIVAGSDGNIYVGSTSGEVMRWKPRTDEWEPLGKPVFTGGWALVRALCEGPGQWLYAGSPAGRRARIHLETGVVEKLPEIPEAGNWYVASVAALPDGRIAFGCGHQARLFVYDPQQGKDVGQWLPPGWIEDGFITTLTVGPSVVYALHAPSRRLAAFDARTGQLLSQVPWPDDTLGTPWSQWVNVVYGDYLPYFVLPGTDTIMACDGQQVYPYNPRRPDLPPTIPWDQFRPPADLALTMRYEVTTDCRVLEYDGRRLKVVKSLTPPQPQVERLVYSLGVGPDGQVYGGAFQSMLLFRCDPRTGETTLLGDQHPGWSGEIYSFAIRQDELICASYINGAMVAYSPNKPWQCERGDMVNPRLLGFLGQRVYRPFSTCVSEDGKVWSVGSAGWGTTGGGVAFIDPVTHQTEATALPEAPVDVLPLSGNRLLLCSSGRLRWWDGTVNEEIAQAAPPVPLVSATLMEADPPSRILMASAQELVVVKANQPGQVVVLARHTSPIPCDRALVWKEQAVVGGSQGLATVDLQTGEAQHFCSTPLAFRGAFVVAGEAVFFSAGGHLMTVPLPGPGEAPKSPATHPK
jgi:hypothetical protein